MPRGPRHDEVLARLGLVSVTWAANRLGYSREGVRRLWLRGVLEGVPLDGPETRQTLVFRRDVVDEVAARLVSGPLGDDAP